MRGLSLSKSLIVVTIAIFESGIWTDSDGCHKSGDTLLFNPNIEPLTTIPRGHDASFSLGIVDWESAVILARATLICRRRENDRDSWAAWGKGKSGQEVFMELVKRFLTVSIVLISSMKLLSFKVISNRPITYDVIRLRGLGSAAGVG